MCWEAAGDLREAVSDDDYARGLTWDVRLAVALLEATSDPQIGGKFWDVYGRMLPQPHTIAVRIGSHRVAVRLCYVMSYQVLFFASAAVVSPFSENLISWGFDRGRWRARLLIVSWLVGRAAVSPILRGDVPLLLCRGCVAPSPWCGSFGRLLALVVVTALLHISASSERELMFAWYSNPRCFVVCPASRRKTQDRERKRRRSNRISPCPATSFSSIPFPARLSPKVPFCLPERLLTQLHNDGMAKRAAKQVDRLRSIYPDLMRSLLSHPKTAIYAAGKADEAVESDVSPMALVWAFAMVRSRAFTSNDDRFALVPFLVRKQKKRFCIAVSFVLPER